ncbi:MAG: alpha amylase catalytic sub domain protein [Frankiales bacterium]|nr:alpha amylase catalytic sub domain protein [Frankiales bacterium]
MNTIPDSAAAYAASGVTAGATPAGGLPEPAAVGASAGAAVDATTGIESQPDSLRTMIGRIPIFDVTPTVGQGRWPARAVVGEAVTVGATVFREGHDAVNANVVLIDPAGTPGAFTPMRLVGQGTDRWEAVVTPTSMGQWSFVIEAWGDPYATWHHNAEVKLAAGQDISLELAEGANVLEAAAAGPARASASLLRTAAKALRDESLTPEERLAPAFAADVMAALAGTPLRQLVTASDRFGLWVDRERALFSSWYEFFPRSEGAHRNARTGEWVSGNFTTAAERLPAVAAMGFDIVYLPPIHPIGRTFRKGPNNTLEAGPDDPGSPWAIGGPEGGHDAIHPDLGTFADFDSFVRRASAEGLEVAIDLALQASPDHPWVKTNPEWFSKRADGTIAYAENPPKKYQDIYPINFDNDPEGILAEVDRIVRLWMSHGVRVFRVDNPHTKPWPFWEALIGGIRQTDPDVIFLAEAFTRPALMHTLGQIGFTQSYTYFTCRNTLAQLDEKVTELAGDASYYMRPNFWPNTPDILPEALQYGGPPAFKIRAALAALLTPSWGMYAGFELFEHQAVRAGSEEYLNSEKYEYRPRDWAAAEAEGRTLSPYLALLNRVRRQHPALHRLRNVHFHDSGSPDMICFSKRLAGAGPSGSDDTILVVANLDPHGVRETTVRLDLPALGFGWADRFAAHDLVTQTTYDWGDANYVRLDPFTEPVHIFVVRRNP